METTLNVFDHSLYSSVTPTGGVLSWARAGDYARVRTYMVTPVDK